MSKQEKERKISPPCACRWAHLHEPHEQFDKSKGKKFEVELLFDKDNAEMCAFAGALKAQVKELRFKNFPVKKDMEKQEDGTKVHTGKFFVPFTTGEAYPPRIYNNQGGIIGPETLIGNGSIIQVSYNENEYDGFGGGINLYMNAVKVIELVAFERGDGDGFEFDTSTMDEDFGPATGSAVVGPDGKNDAMREATSAPVNAEVPDGDEPDWAALDVDDQDEMPF